jgi:hypothetical protein
VYTKGRYFDMSKQSKLTKSAKGQECQVRIVGICNFNPETTVLAHLDGGGMGAKRLDIHGAYACSDCHTWVDGGYTQGALKATKSDRDLWHHEAMVRTQEIMVANGVLVI